MRTETFVPDPRRLSSQSRADPWLSASNIPTIFQSLLNHYWQWKEISDKLTSALRGTQPTTWPQTILAQHLCLHLTHSLPCLSTQTCSAPETSTLRARSQAMAFCVRLPCRSSSHCTCFRPEQTFTLLGSLYPALNYFLLYCSRAYKGDTF